MRPFNWPELLTQYVDQARGNPFAWGTNDCVTFSASWFALMTGDNPAGKFAGHYATEREALEIMVRHGVKSIEAAGWFLYGQPSDHVAFAGRGDIVCGKGALGLCLGSNGAFLTETGLAFYPRETFEQFWKV